MSIPFLCCLPRGRRGTDAINGRACESGLNLSRSHDIGTPPNRRCARLETTPSVIVRSCNNFGNAEPAHCRRDSSFGWKYRYPVHHERSSPENSEFHRHCDGGADALCSDRAVADAEARSSDGRRDRRALLDGGPEARLLSTAADAATTVDVASAHAVCRPPLLKCVAVATGRACQLNRLSHYLQSAHRRAQLARATYTTSANLRVCVYN